MASPPSFYLEKSYAKVIGSATGSRSTFMRTAAFQRDKGEERIQQEGLIGGDEDVRAMGGGLEATLNRQSKWLISAVLFAVMIWKHDGEAMWLVTGSVVNKILSSVLKRILNQDRPVSTLKSDPGMPSSHSQSIFYAAAYVIVSMINWLGVNGLSLALSSAVLAISSYLSWLRVTQQFHTVAQVLVGAILGSGFSIFWIWSWHSVVQEAYISQLWVRVSIALGAVGFFIAVIRHRLKNDS